MAQSDGLQANVGQLYHNSEAGLSTAFMGVFDEERYLGGAVIVIDHANETESPTVRYVPQRSSWENRPGVVSDMAHLYITRERPGRRDDNCEVVRFDTDLRNETVVFSAQTGCSVMGTVTNGDIDYVLINQQHPIKRSFFARRAPRNVSVMVLKVTADGVAEVGSDTSGAYTNSTGFLAIPGRGFVKAANPADRGVDPDPSKFLAYRPSDLSGNTYSTFDSQQDAIAYVLGDTEMRSIQDALSPQDTSTPSTTRFSPQDLIVAPEEGDTLTAVAREGFAKFKFIDAVDLRGEAIGLPLRSDFSEPIPYNRYVYRGAVPFTYEGSSTLDFSELVNFIPRR